MSSIFSENLKKLRMQKNLTQEQVANILGVTAQTVSRWECASTLPDVMLLPELAKLYCVSIDDFYKENPSAYANLFQRYACVYQRTKDPEDFIRAYVEFKKMKKTDSCSLEDMRMYGLIHQGMMGYCKNKAIHIYDQILEKAEHDRTYWLTKAAKANFLVITGNNEKIDEFIQKQYETAAQDPENAEELHILIRALYYAGRNQEAYDVFAKAKDVYPAHAELLFAGGDVCRKLKKYDEAFLYLNQVIALGGIDGQGAKCSKAACYEALGDYEKAYSVWLELIKDLKKDGYDVDAARAEERAQNCLEKINL